jgi:erythromycin esterase
VGLGISLLFASTTILAAAQNIWLKQNTKEIKFAFEMQGITELYAVMNKYGTFSNRSSRYKAEIKKVIDKYKPQYKNLIQFIKDNRVQLAAAYPNNPHIVDIVVKSLSNRVKFIEMCLYI